MQMESIRYHIILQFINSPLQCPECIIAAGIHNKKILYIYKGVKGFSVNL